MANTQACVLDRLALGIGIRWVFVTNTNRGEATSDDDHDDHDDDEGGEDDDDGDGVLDRLPMGVCDKHKQGESTCYLPQPSIRFIHPISCTFMHWLLGQVFPLLT